MGLPLADDDPDRQGNSDDNNQARPLSGIQFNQIIADRLESTHNSNRRNSLPPGILEHIDVKNVCGQILRFMGDEHFSKTCGRHLRCMGDEISHLYWLKKTVMGSPQTLANDEQTLTHNSQSLPDLRESDQQLERRNEN